MTAKPEPTEPSKKRRPSFPVYAVDRLSDPGLRACSRAARSFYADLECYTYAYGEPQGFLTLENGMPLVSAEQLAAQFPDSLKDIAKWLDELTKSGVIARAENGVISLPKLIEAIAERAVWAARKAKSAATEGKGP